jgi:glycosyltransferase involved in cell wall biosynthesis
MPTERTPAPSAVKKVPAPPQPDIPSLTAVGLQVLYVTADFPWPPSSGGPIRTLSQIRVLASLPEVERVCYFGLREREVEAAECDALAREIPKLEVLAPVFHPIHLFAHPRYVPRVAWLRLFGVPYFVGKWESPAVRRALEHTLAERWDVVWVSGIGMARYLPLMRQLQPRARVVLDQHDVENDKFAQLVRRHRGIKKLAAEAEWKAARRFERDALRAVDAVAAISDDDARMFADMADVEAVTVPQVVPFARRAERAKADPRFCYAGNLRWTPNVRGLDWFCQEVWPLIRSRLGEATFEIAGTRLPLDARGRPVPRPTWRVPGVTTLGFVPDLGKVYERSAALAAPSFGGTGVRIKLLEAFRHGIPVVTTPDGAAGLSIERGREAFIESDPREFASRAVELATSRDARERLREAAYAYLGRRHALGVAQAAVRRVLGISELAGLDEVVRAANASPRAAALGSQSAAEAVTA